MKRVRNPWKKLLRNIMLSATYGSAGARKDANPKFSGRLYAKNAANSSQSTKRHEVSIEEVDLREQFEKQRGRCFWFGIELNPMDIFRSRYPLAMSVDRVDNNHGYIKNNIIIACRLANLGRQNCDTAIYREIIEHIKGAIRGKTKPLTFSEISPKLRTVANRSKRRHKRSRKKS